MQEPSDIDDSEYDDEDSWVEDFDIKVNQIIDEHKERKAEHGDYYEH